MLDNKHIHLRWLKYIAEVIKKENRYDLEPILDDYFNDDINLIQLSEIIKENGFKSLNEYKKDELEKDGIS